MYSVLWEHRKEEYTEIGENMEEKGGYERPLGEMKPELDHKEQERKIQRKVIQSRRIKQNRGTQFKKKCHVYLLIPQIFNGDHYVSVTGELLGKQR